MAPFIQCKQRLVALQCCATSTRQEPKAIIQPRRDLFRRKDLGPCRGEFNRQRNTVQPSANVRDGRRILLLEAEGWIGCHCTINEEVHTVILCKRTEVL